MKVEMILLIYKAYRVRRCLRSDSKYNTVWYRNIKAHIKGFIWAFAGTSINISIVTRIECDSLRQKNLKRNIPVGQYTKQTLFLHNPTWLTQNECLPCICLRLQLSWLYVILSFMRLKVSTLHSVSRTTKWILSKHGNYAAVMKRAY